MRVVSLEKVVELLRKNKVPKVGELHRILTQMSFEVPENSEKSQTQLDILNVYYPSPLLCRYFIDKNSYSQGIVFHEWLVDLESGQFYLCREILRRAQNMGIDLDDAIIERKWESNFL